MNKLFPILLLFCFFISASAQENTQAELDSLRKQLPPLIQQKKLDKVISIAEKIAQIEKNGGEKNLKNYAKALHDLALWIDYKVSGSDINSQAELKKTREIYRELSTLAMNAANPLELATALEEEASFLFRSRFLGSGYTLTETEVVNLYLQAIYIRETVQPPDAEVLLLNVKAIADLYSAQGDFEKFLPLNRRYVAAVEKKFGNGDIRLAPALISYAHFLVTTDRRKEAEELTQRIKSLPGQGKFELHVAGMMFGRAESKINLDFGRAPSDFSRMNEINRLSNLNRQRSSDYVLSQSFESIYVTILTDEKGDVIEVLPETDEKDIIRLVKEGALKWKFRPFIDEGVARKMRGRIAIRYFH